MAGIFDSLSGFVPSGATILSGAYAFLIFIIIIIVIIIAGSIYIFFLWNKKFNRKIRIFQKVNGKIQEVDKDKAMFFKVSAGGDSVLFLKKYKKWLPIPQIQAEPNTYWYYVREDGEWIDFQITDIDIRMKEAGVHFLDKDARLARTSIQKLLSANYNKPSFLEKYGHWIALGIFLLLMGIMFWFSFSQFLKITQANVEAMKIAKEVMEVSKDVLGTIGNFETSGVRTI